MRDRVYFHSALLFFCFFDQYWFRSTVLRVAIFFAVLSASGVFSHKTHDTSFVLYARGVKTEQDIEQKSRSRLATGMDAQALYDEMYDTRSLERVRAMFVKTAKQQQGSLHSTWPEKARPVLTGDLYIVLISTDTAYTKLDLEQYSLSLLDQMQNSIIDGLDIYKVDIKNSRHYMSLLPIPNELKEATYVLSITGLDYQHDIAVQKRLFPIEKIALNKKMEALRAPSPTITNEAKTLYAITAQSYPAARFGFDNFLHPFATYLYDSDDFGTNRTYIYPDGTQVQGLAHTGIDIVGPKYEPILSPEAGIVIFARSRLLTGNTVAIAHYPQLISVFFHLDAVFVNEGQGIARGTQIGTQGTTGFSTGDHLHWEIRVRNTRIDPRKLLLPLDRNKIIRILL